MYHHTLVLLVPLALSLPAVARADEEAISITEKFFHLGDSKKPEWKDLTTVEPTHGKSVELEFESKENKRNLVLEVQSGGVGGDWKVKLNSRDLGLLKRSERLETVLLMVPPATLKDGKNKLEISTAGSSDDIYVGKVTLHRRPAREVLGLVRVSVLVKDADTGEGLPCRLTLTRAPGGSGGSPPGEEKDSARSKDSKPPKEELVEFILDSKDDVAVRKGILYVRDGTAAFDLEPGAYNLHATRGFEYGLGLAPLDLKRGEKERPVEISLRREVDTTGYLAADTHMHTKTHSGHGDIDVRERLIAIAGEGVEVAVATDHNHNTDYSDDVEKAKLKGKFATIVGNEVTTSLGHFNAFPFARDAKAPPHDQKRWAKVIEDIRRSPGVRFVILNHPRRPLSKLSILEEIRFQPLSGEIHRGPAELGVDGIEVFNGKTLTEDPMETLRDWFGLMNHGHLVKAVAGSDSHAVDEIVGQARTYLASPSDDPSRTGVQEICDSFADGKLLVSLGLLAQARVDGKFTAGDLATSLGKSMDVEVKVQGPSWTRADRVAMYLNGVEIRKEKLEPTEEPVKYHATWQVPVPPHDAHLVVMAAGPPVTAPYWPISGGKKRYVAGATNPIWIDGDGDGKFTSARSYAADLVKEHGTSPRELRAALKGWDSAVAVQAACLTRARLQEEAQELYARLMATVDKKAQAFLGGGAESLGEAAEEYFVRAPRIEIRTRTEVEEEARRIKSEQEEEEKKKADEEKKAREKKRAEEKKQAGSRKTRSL